MFLSFQADHEKSLLAVLRKMDADRIMVDAALLALEKCRMEIIEELRTTHVLDRRRELNVLYEGFSILCEFIYQDVSVPAVRGF